MERSKPVLKRRVSQKLFFKGPNYSDSTPINLRSASDTRSHLRQESAEFRLKSGLRDAETTLFNACPWGLSTKERGKGTGCVQRTVPSTSAFRRPGGWGGRVPGAAGDPAAGAPAGSLPERSSYLWDRRARWRGGEVGEWPGPRWGSVPSIPRPGTAPPAPRAPLPQPRPGPPPTARGGRHPAGGGGGGSGSLRGPPRPLWAAHPSLPAPGWPATGRETRQETRGRGGPAGRGRGCQPRTPTARRREPGLRASRHSPGISDPSLLPPPPPCHCLLGDHKSGMEVV